MENFRSENLVIVKAGILREIIEKAVTSLILINQDQRNYFVQSLIKDIIGNESTVITNLNEVSDGHRNIATEIIDRIGKETRLQSHPELYSRVVSVVYGTMNDYRDTMERKTESRFRLNNPIGDPTNVAGSSNKQTETDPTLARKIDALDRNLSDLCSIVKSITERLDAIEKAPVPSYLLRDSETHISSHQEGP